ncbi:uncharacterized protein LOC106637205 [Copidosoma floridanum]|uniref:uncharacterized protein LOC106637205 n=1 Tax=Copidosoma floridanum TaxID=29053 RepID=UPI0006C9AAE8|nr:uncharacterized protein LOC106637205 [Copidosoma floridanum]
MLINESMKIAIIVCIYLYHTFVLGLKEVRIQTPMAVKKGDNATLYCLYDLETDPLYIVKWYKSGREFYRFVPQEQPAIKLFPVGNIHVKESESNSTQVTLIDIDVDAAGSFSCEVSVDAPLFQTAVVSGSMNVVELPLQRPVISGLRSKYRVDDVLKLNCSSSYSRPVVNLTWYMNDQNYRKLCIDLDKGVLVIRNEYVEFIVIYMKKKKFLGMIRNSTELEEFKGKNYFFTLHFMAYTQIILKCPCKLVNRPTNTHATQHDTNDIFRGYSLVQLAIRLLSLLTPPLLLQNYGHSSSDPHQHH